jgi:Glycosyltransferase Family 4
MIAAAPPKRRHLALILDHLGVGGVQKMTLALGRELVARGYCVDLVVCDTAGPLARRLPDGIRLFGLERSNSVTTRLVALRSDPGGLGDLLRPVLLAPVLPAKMLYTAGLASYLRQRKPQGLIAATRILNIIAVWAARLARASLPIVLSERNPPSAKINGSSWWHQRQLPQLMARTYRFAEAIVAVSDSVADDLAALTDRQGPTSQQSTTRLWGPTWLGRREHPAIIPGSLPVNRPSSSVLVVSWSRRIFRP